MKSKRSLSLLLAALMLVSPLASCSTANEGGTVQTTADQTAASAETETTLQDNLPDDLDFKNTELFFAGNSRTETKAELAVEGLEGEPVNDAVYERNLTVEKRLNVKITSFEQKGGIVDKVATVIKAGSAEFDMVAAECCAVLPKTLEGLFMNLNQARYMDLTQPWWSQGFNHAVSHRDSQYAATGSLLLSLYRFCFVTVFNKRIFDDAGQTYLYDFVENGTWTLDKQIEMIPIFYRDNGNGEQDLQGDVYGFISTDATDVDAYWSACALKIVDKNADNEYEFVFNTARVFEAAEKLIRLFHGTDGATYQGLHTDGDWDTVRSTFANGNAAIASFRLLEMENESIRSMSDEFGVVPIAKFDKQQPKHQTLLHDQFTVISIPVTVVDERLDMVSATLEALASTGERTVKNVYYEDTLRTKIAQDPQSAEMMDIIVNGVYIDAGILYVQSMNQFHHGLRDVVMKGQNDTTSRFKSKSSVAEKSLKQINIKLARISEKQADAR